MQKIGVKKKQLIKPISKQITEKQPSLRYKAEYTVDKIIPYLVILLLFVIIIEFFFHEIAEEYQAFISFADWLIVFVFVLDLGFKYERMRAVPKFLRKYWIEIIAVFPFFLMFRVFEEIGILLGLVRAGEGVREVQAVLHEGVELEKYGKNVVRAIEESGKVSRVERMSRFIRPILRTPRLARIIPFFERPNEKNL